MTYVSANRRPNAAALAGALGIPGAFGALLVVGLAVTVVTAPPEPRIKGEIITETPLPPPPPPTPETPRADAKTTTTTTTTTPTPTPPNPFPVDLGKGETVTTITDTGTPVTTGPIEFGIPGPTPGPASLYDPVGAKPRGNPGKWVTNDDYRPRWIAEELSGTARFTLQIDARGRVTGCTITRSTGHAALDAATCDLVSKRARFDAARDGNGKPVAGTYANAVTWRIPE
ncbi:TonB family protein [Porphyrobacter sp. AAP82]|uniref:TonB family protein n=1 Tax=Porphyrobacter sp. AAP82 TaxID=1248917 RepID=UPI0002E30893|nr:TonB family protein [Porphyrobacter sp. AAP82]